MEMTELEKVIKEWEAVLSRDPLDAPWDLIDDTLALLKEQANTINTQLGIISLQKQQIEMALCELQVVSNKLR